MLSGVYNGSFFSILTTKISDLKHGTSNEQIEGVVKQKPNLNNHSYLLFKLKMKLQIVLILQTRILMMISSK